MNYEKRVAVYDKYAIPAMQGMLAAFKRWPDRHDLRRVAELALDAAECMALALDDRMKNGLGSQPPMAANTTPESES